MTDVNLPAPRMPGSDTDEAQRADLHSKLGHVRDTIARDFSDEVFAHRLAVLRSAVEVAVKAIDALYDGATMPAESTRYLGAVAAAEAAGDNPESVNVAPVVGDKAESSPQLPDPREKAEQVAEPANPLSEAAPGNMTTDPRVNPNLNDDGTVKPNENGVVTSK